MNITIVSTLYPLRGGIAHYNALLMQELGKRHTVRGITFKRQYPALLFPGKTQEETPAEIHPDPAPQLIDSINPLNWLSVARGIRAHRPDLLLFKYWLPFFGPCFGTIARHAKKDSATKVLFICDNIIPHEHRVGDRLFTRYAFRQAHSFIVQSDAVERDLLAFWPHARYKKVPHPMYSIFGSPLRTDNARRTLNITSQRVLLFFGYVRRYKGLHVLLDAMAMVVRHLDVHLLVVGEFYDDEQTYRRQVTTLSLDEHVSIISEYVPNDRVRLFFSAADAVVLPYLSATQSGITQIAYNFDRPVIATGVGGLAEVVHDSITGFIVPPNDPRALAARILDFYQKDLAAEFGAHVREEKGKYSWSSLTQAIEELAR